MDEADRRIAVALQVNGRASWLQVARAVGISESTVARRAQRMIRDEQIRVAAIADPVRCGFGYWVLLQIKCQVGAGLQVAHALADRPDVRYVAVVTGTYDLIVELIVPSRQYLAWVLLEQLPEIRGIQETTTRTVLRNFKMAYDWSRDLLGEDASLLERRTESTANTTVDGVGETRALDAVDRRLYELLLENGRESYSRLALEVGISESMARRRVEVLWERGCIKFATLVDPELLEYNAECICWVRVDLSRLEQAAELLSSRREVRYLSATIDHSDLICDVILRSQEDLYEFCTGTLSNLPGLQEVDVSLKLHTVKQAYIRLIRPGEEKLDEEPPHTQGSGK